MITGIQIAIVAGGLVGLGATLVVAWFMPASVDAKWAMGQLDPQRATPATVAAHGVNGLKDQVGVMLQKRVASDRGWARVPAQDLAIIDRPIHEHLGEKGLLALVGLLFPPLFGVFTSLIGIGLPMVLPLAASLGLAAVLWVAPDLRVKADAKKARKEFIRALATYIDLVALERASGTGTTQALDAAAAIGDSWVFTRISEQLAHARWSGQSPWDGLKDLADTLVVPELGDLAEIMRLSREEGASVYTQLRARAASIRNALLSEDLAKANAASEQMSAPVATLALIFLALLGAPGILRIAFGS